MPNDNDNTDVRKDALAVLSTQIQTHERYHTQKENMTWLVSVAYLGVTMLLVGRDPFWECWPVQWFVVWLALLFVTAISVLALLHSQFRDRHRASAFFLAANDVAVEWAAKNRLEPDDLRPKRVCELDGMIVFAAVETRFRELFHGRSSFLSRITFLLVSAWSIAAAVYIVAKYSALA